MEVAALIDQLEADGPLLAAAAAGGGWSTQIPNLTWDMQALVTHIGGVHRWATEIVANAADYDYPAGQAVGTGPEPAQLLEWFLAGHSALVSSLRDAPSDLDRPMFLPAPDPLTFWARRQAHETAIHRVDAESAVGSGTPFPAEFAQDGIAEILLGFAARPSRAKASGNIALIIDDGPSWSVRISPETITAAESGVADADLTVAGSGSDIYRWLWNRTSAVTCTGDPKIADCWSEAIRVRWS